jgi:hypothetical protein
MPVYPAAARNASTSCTSPGCPRRRARSGTAAIVTVDGQARPRLARHRAMASAPAHVPPRRLPAQPTRPDGAARAARPDPRPVAAPVARTARRGVADGRRPRSYPRPPGDPPEPAAAMDGAAAEHDRETAPHGVYEALHQGDRAAADQIPDQLATKPRCPVAQADRRSAGRHRRPGRLLDRVLLLGCVPPRVRHVAGPLPPHPGSRLCP